MRTVLLANELGSGHGHLNQLISIAQRLVKTNKLVFALREATAAGPTLAKTFGEAYRCLPAPVWHPLQPDAKSKYTETFADVLGMFGFSDADRLGGAVKRWHAILKEVQPDLVIADFSPSLHLACDGNYPIIVIGNGYTIPPQGRMMPPIRPWILNPPPQSRLTEAEILTSINRCQHAVGGKAVDFVANLFSGTETFSCNLEEFDPYKGYRSLGSSWPTNIPSFELPGTRAEEPAIFVYLPATHPILMPLIKALNVLKRPSHVYISGVDPQRLAQQCGSHIGIFKRPADLAKVLPSVALLIHHGGLATSHAGLGAGIPQLIISDNLERTLNSKAIVAMGAGKAINAHQPSLPDLGQGIDALLKDNNMRATALDLANFHRSQSSAITLNKIEKTCLRLLQS